MAAAGRRPVGQASGTRPLPAPEPGPQGRAWQGASPAAQPTQGAGERREAGQEVVTGRERGESGSGNALLQTPPCWHGEPLRAVISLATRPALGDNGPPNRRSRETDRHAHQRPWPEAAAGTCGHLLADSACLPRLWFLPEVSFVWDPELPVMSRGVVGPVSPSTRPPIPTNPAGFGSIKVDERSALPRYLARLREA